MRFRRDNSSRKFKGSVFVEFSEFKELERFVELGTKAEEDSERPKWEGTALQIMTK